jgi:hypothetical protein
MSEVLGFYQDLGLALSVLVVMTFVLAGMVKGVIAKGLVRRGIGGDRFLAPSFSCRPGEWG